MYRRIFKFPLNILTFVTNGCYLEECGSLQKRFFSRRIFKSTSAFTSVIQKQEFLSLGLRATCYDFSSQNIYFGGYRFEYYHKNRCKNERFYSKKSIGEEKTGTPRVHLEKTKQIIQETKDKVKGRVEDVKERVEELVRMENVMTVPNLLCVTRIALSPYLGYLVIQHSFDWALGLFLLAGVTDLLDGFIARNFKNQQSMIGSFLDPMADKLLVCILVVTMTISHMIPVTLTTMIIARDALLVGAGFYIRYVSLPPPKTLSRYFDVKYATARLSPTFISKVNTAIQIAMVGFTLAAPVFNYVDHPYLHTLWYITAGSTVCSALSYVFSKNTYKLLQDSRKKNKD